MQPISVFCIITGHFLVMGGYSNAEVTFARVDSLPDALRYLVKFGYLKDLNEVASLLRPSFTSFDPLNPAVSVMRIAFTKFQQFAKLPVSGKFDAPTKAKMNTPRCGNKDILQINSNTLNLGTLLRRRRFLAGGFEWQKRDLSYRVTKFSDTGFSKEITLKEVDTAFQLWGNVTNLCFFRGSNGTGVDIELRFERKAHGDVESFDGRGLTFAHAFHPGPDIWGDIHFDDDEEWTSGVVRGVNFLHVVVHELGHALGLGHSDIQDAIMFPFAMPYNPNLQLHEDDVKGIQSIYGPRDQQTSSPTTQPSCNSSSTPEPSSPPPPTEPTTKRIISNEKPDLCKDSKIDAITELDDGSVYVFKDNYAFRIDPNGGGIQRLDEISDVFYTTNGPIDAALTYDHKTFLFKGNQYWRFVNRKIDGTFPRLISQDFPGIPDNLDAAFTWSEDNHMYFFKGDKYWAFDPSDNPPVGKNYPLPISQWYGLPTQDLDGVFTSPTGSTYFFQADNYWLFDNENFEVAETDPPYPQSIREMWFKCSAYRPEPEELESIPKQAKMNPTFMHL